MLDLAVDKVGDALEARLVHLKDAQEKVMGVVEGITSERKSMRRKKNHRPYSV